MWITLTAVVGIVVLLGGAVGVLSSVVTVGTPQEDPCAPDGLTVDVGWRTCYRPGPTLRHYNGTVDVWCGEAAPDQRCFVYEIVEPEAPE